MVDFKITEDIAAEVANRFEEHNPGISVDDYVQEDGEWVLCYQAPSWVEHDPLGPSTPKDSSHDRVAVETLLKESAYVETIYLDAYEGNPPEPDV